MSVVREAVVTLTMLTGAALTGWLVCLYMLLGGPKLWGPHRGVPFCGHPFEQTWAMSPRPTLWTCPKCHTSFEMDEATRRWVPQR